MQVKPNVTSWRSITPGNMFIVCRNLTNTTNYFESVINVDSHMAKNIEWGAVAYLAHSKYGLNVAEVGVNSRGYTTGQGVGNNNYNTTAGITASTTKNVYGIYDMSGGASEYVAACLNNENYIKSLILNDDSIDIYKYIDLYDEYSVGDVISRYGDAVYETSRLPNGSTSWFKDYSHFINSSAPILGRGGQFSNGDDTGLFFFGRDLIDSRSYCSFRPVCVVY